MTHALNEFLFNRHGYADRRHKKVQFDRAIALDGGRPDFKESIHCRFFVYVTDDNVLRLAHAGNRPYDPTVHHLQAPFLRCFRLEPGTPAALRSLAQAYRAVQSLTDDGPSVALREDVAAQLERLARSLEQFMQTSFAPGAGSG